MIVPSASNDDVRQVGVKPGLYNRHIVERRGHHRQPEQKWNGVEK